MKKIFISVTSLYDIGGIGTSAVNLINEIHDKYEVTLCVLTNYISKKYSLPDNVRIIDGSSYLHDVVVSRKLLNSQNILRKAIRNGRKFINKFLLKDRGYEHALDHIQINDEYDIAIAFSDYAYNIAEIKCYDYYFVLNKVKANIKAAWIHNAQAFEWTNNLALERLSKFDYIVNVSKNCKHIFDTICPSLISKSKVVLNTYNIDEIKAFANVGSNPYDNNNDIHIVTVARIEILHKRIDRTIKVCEQLIKDGISNFDWTVVGKGDELENFRNLVKSKGLENNIRFVGHKANPYDYMKYADIFVSCSDYEGYGMAIKEAQILGTPAVVTAFGAAHEVINDSFNGEICENSTTGLYVAIKQLLLNPKKLESYKKNIFSNPVSNEIALQQFEAVFGI